MISRSQASACLWNLVVPGETTFSFFDGGRSVEIDSLQPDVYDKLRNHIKVIPAFLRRNHRVGNHYWSAKTLSTSREEGGLKRRSLVERFFKGSQSIPSDRTTLPSVQLDSGSYLSRLTIHLASWLLCNCLLANSSETAKSRKKLIISRTEFCAKQTWSFRETHLILKMPRASRLSYVSYARPEDKAFGFSIFFRVLSTNSWRPWERSGAPIFATQIVSSVWLPYLW
jgi:hypothetical protein